MEKKNYCSIALLLCTASVIAQSSDSIITKDLSEINVVAIRLEKNNSETPAGITVITSEQLLQSGFSSVADALSETAGIYITGAGQVPGANESIFMRGANSNQTVILLDGVRISDASTVNNTADLSEISIADVDKIEIIRGAHSTLYGSGAVGGVVSITTKRGNKPGLMLMASGSGGTFAKNTFDKRGNILLGYKFENGIYADAGMEGIDVQGADATIDTVTDLSVFKNRDRDNWERKTFHVSTGFQHHPLKADFSLRITKMKTDLDNGPYSDDDNYLLNFRRAMLNGNLEWKFGNVFSSQLSGGFTNTKRHSVNDSSVVGLADSTDQTYFENTYSGKYASADWQLNAHLTNADFLIGLSGNNEDMEQEDYYYSTRFGPYELKSKLDSLTPVNNYAAYLHADFKGAALHRFVSKNVSDFLSLLTLSAGSRLSNHSVIGNQMAYNLTLTIKTDENSILYIRHTTGYNNPSLYQLYAPEIYLPWDGAASTTLTRGNNKLKAEHSATFETGFKQKINNGLQYSVSVFHSLTNNLIEYVYLWNHESAIDTLGNDPWNHDDFRGDRYINIGKQTTTGIEVDLLASLSPKLKLSVNATLVNGKLEYERSASIATQTNSEHVQIYSSGTFITAASHSGTLVRRPSDANIKLIYSPLARLQLIPSIRFVTSRYDIYYEESLGPYGALGTNVVDAYTLVGLTLNVKIWKGINLNLRGENLTNENYEEIHGFTTRKRSLYATLSYTF